MKQTQKPGRRIVSKGRYTLEQGRRAGLTAAGCVAMSFGVFCGILTLTSLFAMIPPHLRALVRTHDLLWHLMVISGYFAMAIYLGFLAVNALRAGVAGIKEAAKSDVVPITRANTADLPAPDSLVRASEEPMQAQQAVLLRAVTRETRDDKALLLRAVAEEE